MTKSLEIEFFEKVKGWVYDPRNTSSLGEILYFSHRDKNWNSQNIAPIATSWDAFQKWVVPELGNKLTANQIQKVIEVFQDSYFSGETPERTLRVFLDEYKKEGEKNEGN